jgi:Delta3-Delta2-enoyl-CoA isomerase
MLDVISHGPIRELKLARPPANALDPALVAALRAALAEATAEGARAVLLSGAPGRFSGGLDVPALLRLDRGGIAAMWRDFFGLLRDLAGLEVPVAAALTGHSPAGGTVLALFCDYRVLADGAFSIGLNEVQVGIPVPPMLLRALQYVVGERQAARLATGGLLVGPGEALRCGLVDELAPIEDVRPRALSHLEELLRRPAHAMLPTRALARKPLVDALGAADETFIETVTEQWFAPEAQAVLRALATRLGKP